MYTSSLTGRCYKKPGPNLPNDSEVSLDGLGPGELSEHDVFAIWKIENFNFQIRRLYVCVNQ